MAANFDTAMSEALDDAASQKDGPKPGDLGWIAKVPLNYDHIKANRDDLDALIQSGEVQSWAHDAARYVWDDEYGDVGPVSPELEMQLYNKTFNPTVGDDLHTLTDFKVTLEGEARVKPIKDFKSAGLHPVMVENVEKCGYVQPTPVQAYAIPAILLGKDLIAVSQTGSGKTAAYFIPVLSKLMGKAKKLAAPRPNPCTYNPMTDRTCAEPLVLVICPTRELAIQIFDEARRLCYRTMLRPGVAYGGGPRRAQLEDLERGCDVLIGTPGRLKDIIVNCPRNISLRRLKFTILDEADEMLGDDWAEELKEMLGGGASQDDGDHQYMMFSATFPKAARELARQYLADDHIRVRVGRAGSSHKNVVQAIIWAENDLKQKAIYDLLLALPPCRTMIFCNTTRGVDVLDDYLYNQDFPCTSIHSARYQREREDAIQAFRKGTCPILITTGVCARGMDVKNVMHIINYDLPSMAHGGIDEYVHRIGRTARIGNKGRATSFYNERNSDIAEALVKILLECKQDVPDFLEQYKPANDVVTWDDDTDDEGEVGKENEESGWGAGVGNGGVSITADDAGWGSAPTQATSDW